MNRVTATLVSGHCSGGALWRLAFLLGTSAVLPQLSAADEEMPNIELLEYLGSWEESDDEWLLFQEDLPSDDENAELGDNADDVAAADEQTELNNER